MAVELSCPVCRSLNVRLLPHVASRHSPDFYRCESCTHVWWIAKPQPASPERTKDAADT